MITRKAPRLGLGLLMLLALATAGIARPLIFPFPRECEPTVVALMLDDAVSILLPTEPSENDLLLAREISADLSRRFGIAATQRRVTAVPAAGRVIVMGRYDNPLVRQVCADHGQKVDRGNPGAEGYALVVNERIALVAGSDDQGAFYGMQSLRQLMVRPALQPLIRGAVVRDWPHKAFRGIRLCLPGPDNIAFFKRFVRDFVALNKYNQLILEVNASMRLDRHPELNAGWTDLANALTSTRRNRPFGPRGEEQDSVHHDNADSLILEQRDVADLVRYAREYHVDVTPEIPSLSHSYYLLTRRRDIAEMPDAEWPDAYCPSNPESTAVLFDVLQEYIDVMQPRFVHIGHDEWRIRLGACPRCRGKDARLLYAKDVSRIHAWLHERGVGTMMWGDHLIERLRGKDAYDVKTPDGFAYQRPGGLSAEIVEAGIPKDIVVANWMWQEPYPGQGEVNDLDLARWGFRQFYGNLEPQIRNWGRRSAHPSVIGGAASSWAATNEENFGKDQIFDLMAVANLVWATQWPSLEELTGIVQAEMPSIRERLSGRRAFSALGDPRRAIDLGAAVIRVSVGGMTPAATGAAPEASLPAPSGNSGAPATLCPGIPINADASSVIFVHAAEKPAKNQLAYRIIHNVADTADLLGYYEVLYTDGYVETIPIRYGVHLLERDWSPASRPRTYCYLADPVSADGGQTFFAYEWRNPRLGKTIQSVSFKATSGFVDARGEPLPANAVLIKAITLVEPRPYAVAKPYTTED